MSDLLSAQEEKLNTEAFGELPVPRGIIVSSLCGSTNQRFAVICAIGECSHSELAREMSAEPTVNGQTCLSVGKGDFPFPFQTSDQNNESEVKSRMQPIDFYCKKCKKSMRISYVNEMYVGTFHSICLRNVCENDETLKMHTLNVQKFLPFLMKSTRLMCSIPLRF